MGRFERVIRDAPASRDEPSFRRMPCPCPIPGTGGETQASRTTLPRHTGGRLVALLAMAVLAGISSARADGGVFNITPEEHRACDGDAERLCSAAYPDPDGLIACMKNNRASLGPSCKAAFEGGMRKRHLSL